MLASLTLSVVRSIFRGWTSAVSIEDNSRGGTASSNETNIAVTD